MITTLIHSTDISADADQTAVSQRSQGHSISRIEKGLVWCLIKLRIFFLACIELKKPAVIIRTFQQMLQLRSHVWGGDLKKLYRVNGRYYFNQYTPGWPSAAYDQLIRSELRRRVNPFMKEQLSFVFFAITRKCPMRCEHCFEWDNLNQKETFTKDELIRTVQLYQQQGVLQFHFSGGEPMTRIKELKEVIRIASKKSECWVLTSGFNLNEKTAHQLKQCGCKGVVISIDHYIPELHNMFRGHPHAFDNAVHAVAGAQSAGLVVSISVCATKAFLDGGHLMPYMKFANELGVHFVQVLEPRNVGHYADKNVLLENHHIDELEKVFKLINLSAAFAHYPTMLYHGYHQRRVGCFSGSRSVYIDSAGDVHACPFCHTKSYNIVEVLRSGMKELPDKENACPQFGKVA